VPIFSTTQARLLVYTLCCLPAIRTPLARGVAVYKIGAYPPGARNNTVVHEPYAGDIVWREASTALEALNFEGSYLPTQRPHVGVHPFVVCEVSLPWGMAWDAATTLDPLIPLGGRRLRHDARIVRILGPSERAPA
jgi:hypothetical protein